MSSCGLINSTTINSTSITVCETITDSTNCKYRIYLNASAFTCNSTCAVTVAGNICCPSTAPLVASAGSLVCINNCTDNTYWVNGTLNQCGCPAWWNTTNSSLGSPAAYLCVSGPQRRFPKQQCGWSMYSRVWYHSSDCVINDTWDAQELPSGVTSGVDLSVINVNNMFTNNITDVCVFQVARVGSSGSISNALFVFNVTLDLSRSMCSEIWVAPFDDVRGAFKNVSIVGNISLINIQTPNLTTSGPQIFLSRFAGNMIWNPSTGNRTVNGTALYNISTALNYIVNGTLVTADN